MTVSARDKIVSAARRTFYERGYEDTSFADIAKASGVPKGNFYYHFKSKAELLAAVMQARVESVEGALQAWGQALPSAQERLQRFVRMLTSEKDDLVRFGCPMGSLLVELGKKRQPELHEQARALLDIYIAWAARQFAERGQSPKAARDLAVRLLSRCQGAVLVAQAYGDSKLLEREVRDIERWLASTAS